MATRATIGYLNPDNTITTTYNHYDGYPENLGVALKNHYDTNETAKEVANMGYVSYIDPESGNIEANNKSNPVTVGDSDLVSSIQYFKDQASEADYAYLWVPQNEEWMYAPTAMKMEDFVDVFVMGIDFIDDEDDMADYDSIDSVEEGYETKWKSFISEESFFKDDPTIIRWEKIRDNAYRMLKHEDGNQVNFYVDALERQIKFNPSDADELINYDKSDFQADFDDYISDKMDS